MKRDRIQRALERYFARRSYPRLIMSTIVLATGAAGFYSSVTMLKLGLDRMWLRYLGAFAIAYLVFLLLVRGWVALERKRFVPNEGDTALESASSPVQRASGSLRDHDHWWDWRDLPSFDFDLEGCALGLVLAAATAIIIGAFLIISAAPTLLAEVFLDAVLMTVLYRRLKNAALHHWLGTALARTWQPMLIAALLCAAAGAALQRLEPGARTIGEVWRLHHAR